MTSTFDPTQFLDATTTEAATRRPPLPIGDYIGVLGEPGTKQVQGKQDPSKSYIFLEIPVTIDLTSNPKLREQIGRDSVDLRYSTSIDTNETGIDWSAGKNTGLRLLRVALNMNTAGQAFSIRNVQGRMLKVKIKHREYPENSGEFQDEIAAVAKP